MALRGTRQSNDGTAHVPDRYSLHPNPPPTPVAALLWPEALNPCSSGTTRKATNQERRVQLPGEPGRGDCATIGRCGSRVLGARPLSDCVWSPSRCCFPRPRRLHYCHLGEGSSLLSRRMRALGMGNGLMPRRAGYARRRPVPEIRPPFLIARGRPLIPQNPSVAGDSSILLTKGNGYRNCPSVSPASDGMSISPLTASSIRGLHSLCREPHPASQTRLGACHDPSFFLTCSRHIVQFRITFTQHLSGAYFYRSTPPSQGSGRSR